MYRRPLGRARRVLPLVFLFALLAVPGVAQEIGVDRDPVPACSADPETVEPNQPTVLEVACVGADASGPLVYTVTPGPQHGQVTFDDLGQATYTPVSGYTGTDTFSFTAQNAAGVSLETTQDLTVVHVNHPPFC